MAGSPVRARTKASAFFMASAIAGPALVTGGGIGLKLDGAAQDEPHAPIIALRANRKGGRGMHPTIYCQTY